MIIILKSSSIEVLLIAEVVQICQTLSFSNQDNCLEPSLSFPAKGWISSNLAFPWLGDKVTIERSLQKFVCRANLRPELAKICLFEKPSEKFVCRIIFRSKNLHQLAYPNIKVWCSWWWGYFAKKWGASIVAIRIVCFVGFYDLTDEDKMVREVFEKNEMHIVRCSAHTLHIGRFYSNGLLISPPSLNARWEF